MRTVSDLKDTCQYGMHACGYYAGTKHSNTLDGMNYWRKKGVNIIEVDISRTTDGKFVALAHGMNKEYMLRLEVCDFSATNVFTHQWFMNQKLFKYSTKGLNPLDVSRIITEMERDEDLIVMFDLYNIWNEEGTAEFTKDLLTIIGERATITDRVVVEAYNQRMINGIKSISQGRVPIIYCVRDNSTDGNHEWMSPEALKEQGIQVVSYPWKYTNTYPGEIGRYVSDGFIVFSCCPDFKDVNNCKLGGANTILLDVVYTKSNYWYRHPLYLMGRVKNRMVQKYIRKYKV